MMWTLRAVLFVVVGVVCVVMSGCSSTVEQGEMPSVVPGELAGALRGGDSFQLLSVDPYPLDARDDDAELLDDADVLVERWEVLGRMIVEDASVRASLVDALVVGIDEGTRDGSVAACFNPRHGILVRADTQEHLLVICLECRQVQWFVDGTMQQGMLVSESPTTLFNTVLGEAGVPLPTR